MPTTRRDFLSLTAAGAGLALAPRLTPFALAQADRRLRILVLGGTRFVGVHFVEAALARGHEVTLFNRGRSDPDAFAKRGVTTLIGNRDPEIDNGLEPLETGEWDAVFDTSSFVPRIANASAQLLKDRVQRYVMVSSISVYEDEAKHGLVESDALDQIDDPAVEEVTGETYGPLKALSEQAVRDAFGAGATILRPGYIVGPHDYMLTRFPLWLERVRRGGDLIAPGEPGDPVQYIDARDIADFAIRSIEQDIGGDFNMVGPADTLTMNGFVHGLAACSSAPVHFHWVDADFLAEKGVFMIPYIPPQHPDFGGFGSVSNKAANDAGMTYRPLAVTTLDTMDYLASLSPEERKPLDDTLAGGLEQTLFDEWRAAQTATDATG
jgi:2'-hydroxyisoflavone reductase